MKQEAWIRWKKGGKGDPELQAECYCLKNLTRKAAERARNAWWEDKAEEAKKKYEMSVKSGRGGSQLKDLRILQRSQTSKTNSTLGAANGSDKVVSVEDKLERWQQHFEQVTNVPTEITETSLNMACSSFAREKVMTVVVGQELRSKRRTWH